MHFKCYVVKVLLKVSVELGKDGVLVLSEVFNCCCMRDSDVYTGLVFAVCKDVGREGSCLFKASV